ncbi:MAG: hypothetical protein J2P45_27075, partial [Candidatus Dormibacteraeota bacterium]|nr:hypothetical protein [Candidatus Dormibacteraeota bacterium]
MRAHSVDGWVRPPGYPAVVVRPQLRNRARRQQKRRVVVGGFLALLVAALGVELVMLEPALAARVLRPSQVPVAHTAPAQRTIKERSGPVTSPPPSPPPPPLAVIPRGQPSVHVPILEYHYVRVNPNPADQLGFNLSVTPANFAAQMAWLAGHGYHPIDIRDLRAYFAGQVDLPAEPVVLSFDDGYSDFYTEA